MTSQPHHDPIDGGGGNHQPEKYVTDLALSIWGFKLAFKVEFIFGASNVMSTTDGIGCNF